MNAWSEGRLPALSVVVCSLGRADAAKTLASVAASAADADVPVERILVWQTSGPPPADEDIVLVDAFPAGLSIARNRGISRARGPIVGFVDDDETVHPEWVKAVLATFGRPPYPDGIFGAVESVGTGYGHCRFDGSDDRVFVGTKVAPWYVGTGGNMAFKRDVLIDAGGFDPAYGPGASARAAEESELIMRLLGAGKTLVWSPDLRVYHPTKTAAERYVARNAYGHAMGRALRRHRKGVLTARYLTQLAMVAGESGAQRDRRRVRESWTQLRGFTSGILRPKQMHAPLAHLELAPPEIAEQLRGASVDPLPVPVRTRPHFLYRVGDERILHVYGSAVDRVRRAIEAKDRIRERTGLDGIPATDIVAEGFDSLWVLEERLRGRRPRARDAKRWFPRAADWSVRFAGEPQAPVETSSDWYEHVQTALDLAPDRARTTVEAALEAMGRRGAVHVHGDFSRKNLVLGEAHLGVVDWEDCAESGIPGRDLLLLAVSAENGPNVEVIRELAGGGDPYGLRARLRAIGISDGDLRRLLLATLAGWAVDEERRLGSLGGFIEPRAYRTLYARFAADASGL